MPNDTPVTDSLLAKIQRNQDLAWQMLQMTALAQELERHRASLTRQLKAANDTITRYEEQWIDEHV